MNALLWEFSVSHFVINENEKKSSLEKELILNGFHQGDSLKGEE